MDIYNVNELNTADGLSAKSAAEAPDEVNAEMRGEDVDLADLVEPNNSANELGDNAVAPLFDNFSLFLILLSVGLIASIAVCHLFGNWYLGFILGGYLGTALGLVGIFIRKYSSKDK